MTPLQLAVAAVVSVVSGVAVGAAGIGGILIVPCLALAGVDPKRAMLHALVAFLVGSVAGTRAHARNGAVPRREAFLVAAGAAVGAAPGTALLLLAPTTACAVAAAVVALFSGLTTLCKEARACGAGDAGRDDASDRDTEAASDGGGDAALARDRGDDTETASDGDSDALTRNHDDDAIKGHVAPLEIAADDGRGRGAVAPLEIAANDVRRRGDDVRAGLAGLVAGVLSPPSTTGGPFVLIPTLAALRPDLEPRQQVGLSMVVCLSGTSSRRRRDAGARRGGGGRVATRVVRRSSASPWAASRR